MTLVPVLARERRSMGRLWISKRSDLCILRTAYDWTALIIGWGVVGIEQENMDPRSGRVLGASSFRYHLALLALRPLFSRVCILVSGHFVMTHSMRSFSLGHVAARGDRRGRQKGRGCCGHTRRVRRLTQATILTGRPQDALRSSALFLPSATYWGLCTSSSRCLINMAISVPA